MTSEVVMLNKDAVVLAADSAVTTGRDPHPRYSKAANKIFDICVHGNVAATIYSLAEIDGVPWELTLKLFREFDKATPQRPHLEGYVDALIAFLNGNASLFPPSQIESQTAFRIGQAAAYILRTVSLLHPAFIDQTETPVNRTAAWAQGVADIATQLVNENIEQPLTLADQQALQANAQIFEQDISPVIVANQNWLHANVTQLVALAIEVLVKRPTEFLDYTGAVIAGYGAEDIFPSFKHVYIYGHIGATLLWKEQKGYAITHTNDAWIQPFAKSTMIDRFTDGFDPTLGTIIDGESLKFADALTQDLIQAGFAIPPAVSAPIIATRHTEFKESWRNQNWNKNFHPLRRVLNSLSVSEMGHLAESLLVLEELRERVTSPSESVGGPVDVAVITKAEGLIWLKRKHYFPSELNSRYFNRMKADYN